MNTSTPETPLQRERRLFRELSSRLIDTIISRLFDLRPEKAARRRGYLFILFLFSGFLISLFYYPLPLWLDYIGKIFNALLTTNSTIPADVAVVNFINFLLAILFDERILQYLPVFIAPYFIALQSAAIYLADIFELEDVSVARRFVSGVALSGSDDTLRIKKGEVPEENQETPIFQIGGPGKVLVELDSVALFEKADGTPHVIGPTGSLPDGKATLEGFERFRQALDIRNHHVDLRDQDGWPAVKGRSRDGIPVKATDVRLMFSIYRGENRETSAENPYPFSKEAVEQIVYKATSKVTPGKENPSTFEFNWIPKMISLIRGKLSGFMSEHKLTEYLASVGMPEFEKLIQREDQIFEQMQELAQSGDDTSGRKEYKAPPEFQSRSKIKSLFAQFADDFSSKARSNGVELHWIGVGTWESSVEIVPEKHLEAWKLSQKNIKEDSKGAMDKIEQEEVIDKTKELIQKVPLDAFEEIMNAYKTSKKSGKQPSKKKENRRFDPFKGEEDDDRVFESEEMDQFAEMLHILKDMQDEKDETEEAEPKDTDHMHDVRELLLEYRKLFQETVDFIRAKKQEVPQNILDAIKHIENQIGHWAGRQP
jgi:hypothetical protein